MVFYADTFKSDNRISPFNGILNSCGRLLLVACLPGVNKTILGCQKNLVCKVTFLNDFGSFCAMIGPTAQSIGGQ